MRARRWPVRLPSHPVTLGAGVFVAYGVLLALYYLVFTVADDPSPVATFFPLAGLTFATFLATPYSRWPVLAAAIWAGEVVVGLLHGVAFGDCALWGVANAAEPMVSVLLLRRLIPPEGRRDLGSLRNLLLFVGCAVVTGPAVVGLIALPTAPGGDQGDVLAFWVRWWVGDGIGVLVVAPFFLALADRRRAEQPWNLPLLGFVALATALTLGPSQLVDGGRGVYLLLPVLLWVAFRGGPRTTAAAVLLVGLAANVVTLWGLGPFADSDRPQVAQVNAQIFIGTLTFSALFVWVLRAGLIRRDQAAGMLRDQALTDMLTGIGNRRMLFERLDDLQGSRGVEAPHRVAFLLVDLDGFKAINDTHGHAAGDTVLEVVAGRLRSTTRSGELVVRLGGDEFLVCLTGATSPAQLSGLAERLTSVLGEPIAVGEHIVSVGASIGVADAAWDSFDPDELLRRADRAMYAVKQHRRVDPDPAPG